MSEGDLEDRRAALVELDALLALSAGTLDARACARLVELTRAVPGRTRRVVEALGRQRDAAAIDALLELPADTGGLLEAVFGALRNGVVRRRADGSEFPHMLALEFRSSSSRRFPGLLTRASAAFGRDLERIRVAGKLHYRLALLESGELAPLRERALPLELDVESLHRDLARLRGVRLWLNGWRFDDRAPLRPRARAPLLRGWFDWLRAGVSERAAR